jgi:transposase-like protein
MLRQWIQSAREAAGTSLRPFPRTRAARDEKLTLLRKETKSPRTAHEIFKKAAVIFARGDPQ